MYKKTALIVLLSLGSQYALADTQTADYQSKTSVEESRGFLGGFTAGALLGGPPGAIAGAIIGSLMGDGFHARKDRADLQVELFESQLELAATQEEVSESRRQVLLARQQIENLQTAAKVVAVSIPRQSNFACCDNTVLSIHFRSGSSAIEPHYREQLDSMVRLADQIPTASVEITGYSDRNGDAATNLQLSRDRSNSIKEFFGRMGVQNSSITTVAYGETKPLESNQSFESDFFDRRVIVRLRDNSQQLLTRSPDGE